MSAPPALGPRLQALLDATDLATRLAADPVAFPRRYPDPRDAEVAGLVAALLAYGRVDLFRPVVAEVLSQADRHGGPRAFAERFEPTRDGAGLLPLVYRWNRGRDLVLLFATLRAVLAEHGGLEPLFAWRRGEPHLGPALARGVSSLRAAAVAASGALGAPVSRFQDLPRGFRTFLSTPVDGSACKRWCLYLRWVCRPADGVDLGLWTAIPPRALVVPLDTHVARIARLVGLTRRSDAGFRTALEVTAGLATLDPHDPTRFDFALAHLGISGACKGTHHPQVCPSCPLQPVCVEG